MPPTCDDAGRAGRRRFIRLPGAALLAVALAVILAGAAVTRGGSPSGHPTLRSAAMAATVDADRLGRDRASRSSFRAEEPVPPTAVTVTHDGSRRDVLASAPTV